MRKRSKLLALGATALLLGAACGGDDGGGGDGDGGGAAEPGATLTFGTSADPVVLDGALVSDGESIRAIDQMMEGLVALKPGTTEVEPALAESWEISEDGLAYTFQLREGVKFHDGTDFNAEAVCYNYDRWYNFKGPLQQPDASYYWQTVFGGFSDGKTPSLYESCEVVDDSTVTLHVTKASSSLLAGLTQSAFTIASPDALEQYKANAGTFNAEEAIFRPTGTYGTEHPTGTGPYKFVEWTRGDRLVFERNEDYWGDFEGNVDRLIFRPIPDPAVRLQALQSGEIQGYDLVDPQDFETIEGDSNFQLLRRPPFNVAYVGFNQAIEPFDDIAVRRAIAHAINREEVIDGFYAGLGVVAKEFMPPDLPGYADDVTEYPYDPDEAKKILTDAGHELPVEIDFAYPTDVERPYMPDPQANFEAMVRDLEDCCFKVETKSATWSPDYLAQVDNGKYGAYLLGWTGDYADPDNFIGTFFQGGSPQFGFNNAQLNALLNRAEQDTNQARRARLYRQANALIMRQLPGVPYAHTRPPLGMQRRVQGYFTSPIGTDLFKTVFIGGQ
jgi:peptide/nickel transport system substrate-binding protein